MSEPSGLGAMDPYGVRALRYVAEYCPRRYATIPEPANFFSALGDQLRAEVLALEPTLEAPTTEGWTETVGRANMARLAAEEAIFSELYRAMPPEDGPPEADPPQAQPWDPLMPDMADIARAEAEGR